MSSQIKKEHMHRPSNKKKSVCYHSFMLADLNSWIWSISWAWIWWCVIKRGEKI